MSGHFLPPSVMMYRSRSFVQIAMDSSGSKGVQLPEVSLWKVTWIFPFSYTGYRRSSVSLGTVEAQVGNGQAVRLCS